MKRCPLQEALFRKALATWHLSEEGSLLERIERMVEPAILAGFFGIDATQIVCGLQYHLGGSEDTRQLAALAGINAADRVLDVCSFLGGPAVQLAETFGCHVTGIDLSERATLAAERIRILAGMEDRLAYVRGDAAHMPFRDGSFTVVWNQASFEHNPAWLCEFDRLLQPGGRLALVFEFRPAGGPKRPHDQRWTFEEMAQRVKAMGYRITHLEDLAEREITLGWQALIQRLEARHDVYAHAFGEAWVHAARKEFEGEIAAMRRGEWSNGRLIAIKP